MGRTVAAALGALAIVLIGAPSASAETNAPLRVVEVRIDRASDLASFEQSVALRYEIHYRKVVAADIDHDGDLDIVAATDRNVYVWVNDGQGHLMSEPPAQTPGVDGSGERPAWRGRAQRVDDAVQDDVPSAPVPGVFAHAPPARVSAARGFALGLTPRRTDLGGISPRAPPA